MFILFGVQRLISNSVFRCSESRVIVNGDVLASGRSIQRLGPLGTVTSMFHRISIAYTLVVPRYQHHSLVNPSDSMHLIMDSTQEFLNLVLMLQCPIHLRKQVPLKAQKP
jgi:hypothetical protein